jgi:hypothetical protein
VVAAPESRPTELERRRVAVVNRWPTRAEYGAQMPNRPVTEAALTGELAQVPVPDEIVEVPRVGP